MQQLNKKVVKALLRTNKVELVCIQETKIQEMKTNLVRSLGVRRNLDWGASGATVGILLFWDNFMEKVGEMKGDFTGSCKFRDIDNNWD